MDASNNSFELPAPQLEVMPVHTKEHHDSSPSTLKTPEVGNRVKDDKAAFVSQAVQQVASAHVMQAASSAAATADEPHAQIATTQFVQDEDFIKQAFQMARKIIEQTKDDPYSQSRELSKVKSSLSKKMFNKDVKIAE